MSNETKPDIMSIINGLEVGNGCLGCPYSSFEYLEDGSGSVYDCALKNHSPGWLPYARLPHRPTGCMDMVQEWLLKRAAEDLEYIHQLEKEGEQWSNERIELQGEIEELVEALRPFAEERAIISRDTWHKAAELVSKHRKEATDA